MLFALLETSCLTQESFMAEHRVSFAPPNTLTRQLLQNQNLLPNLFKAKVPKWQCADALSPRRCLISLEFWLKIAWRVFLKMFLSSFLKFSLRFVLRVTLNGLELTRWAA